MAAPTNPIVLGFLDAPIMEQTDFGPDQDRWLSNIVDIINASFSLLNQAFQYFITSAGIDIGGAGAGPINVTVTGLTPSGYVYAQIVSTTNPGITILSVVPGTDQFAITFSADPGASAIIVYQAYMQRPQ